jgi:type I restriction-modification system DNA methylase subunit
MPELVRLGQAGGQSSGKFLKQGQRESLPRLTVGAGIIGRSLAILAESRDARRGGGDGYGLTTGTLGQQDLPQERQNDDRGSPETAPPRMADRTTQLMEELLVKQTVKRIIRIAKSRLERAHRRRDTGHPWPPFSKGVFVTTTPLEQEATLRARGSQVPCTLYVTLATCHSGKARFQTYLEVNVAKLLDARLGHHGSEYPLEVERISSEEFFRFFLFFGPCGFHGRRPLVQRAIDGSSEYALSVGEDLKERVFQALRLCIEGFLSHAANRLDPACDLEECREQAFVLLYRLLFIMYAEDRGLLPFRRNDLYTQNRSLARHRLEIATALDAIQDNRLADYGANDVVIWRDLVSLFDLVDHGHARYAVPAYNGGLFDPDRHPFLGEKELPDRYLARVIDCLGRARDPNHPERGMFKVDYRDLAIQHLGGIYEGLLELRPRFAREGMIVIRERTSTRRVERVVPESHRIPRGWEFTDTRYGAQSVYLETDKGERKTTGSYYTPEHIVDYIVNKTLGPLCVSAAQSLGNEIQTIEERRSRSRGRNREIYDAQLEQLRRDYDDRILRLRVLDPAMGSGHFLVRACSYLAEEIATNPYTDDPESDQLREDESILTYWKRRVVESCIFGVDRNPMAVELAKVALWLETVSLDAPLSFLDHHLRTGNSLIGGRVANLGTLPGAMELQQNVFKQQVEQQLPALIDPLTRIRDLPSQTPQQIKEKERLYRQTFQPRCEMFRSVADLWCSAFFVAKDNQVTPEQYKQAVESLRRTAEHRRLERERWFCDAIDSVRRADVRAFHWELEFPEIFLNISTQDAAAEFHRGFDAVVGNPPYDVLSERELTEGLIPAAAAQVTNCLTSFQSLIRADPVFEPSIRGKNNLYKLFICKTLDLLAEGGRLGLIVPMPLLGDDQAAAVRAILLERGAFTSVDSFPQKDDPKRRVFPEAKLSTCVFTFVKTNDEHSRCQSFEARQHPENKVQPASPTLMLRTADIPLYDPSNRSIVTSCQADWDLAVRIVASGRMNRLGEFVDFFQGEVNETVQRRRGALLDREGKLVIRGACVCLYAVRDASQGDDIFLNVHKFLEGASPDSKAFHHRHPRVVIQEASPQNNFRRIIAALLPHGEFCNHTINYCPQPAARMPLEFIVGLLNSTLADWYFRLGSTNAHVSHYQIYNLPCPVFAPAANLSRQRIVQESLAAISDGRIDDAFAAVESMLVSPPFACDLQELLVELVRRIMAIEQARGETARTERSRLADAAQPLQDLINRLLYAMAGLTPEESAGLEERLATML